MNKVNKRIVIIILLFIIFVLTWTILSYSFTKKSYTEKQLDLQEASDNSQSDQKAKNLDVSTNNIALIPVITSQNLNISINSTEPITLIDTRSKESFESGHIKSSYHIDSIDSTIIEDRIVLITQTGNEDLIMTIYRNLSATKNVVNLEGGIAAWTNNGYNLISGKPVADFSSNSKVQFIEPRDYDAIIKDPQKKPNSMIIDTRRPGNYANGHVPNAINISLAELEYRYKEIPRGTPIFVYGANDDLSFQSGLLLYDLGFINTKTIRGGFDAWVQYGYEVIK